MNWQRILQAYPTPSDWARVRTIDMHTCGEPLRVITAGFPKLQGNNVLEYRADARDNHDHFRRALMFEPRGHADMYGCVLVPPNDEDGDFGILFLHNEGYSTMCGHAIIAISTLAVEMEWVEVKSPETTLKIDAPCGRITSFVQVEHGQVQHVRFHCVPSFVLGLDLSIEVPKLGKVQFDLAYGGAFYAYVQADQLQLDLTPDHYTRIIEDGMAIKRAIMQSDIGVDHPFEEDLSFLYGTIFIGGPVSEGIDSRNVCVFAEGEVDRCPTGSGVSGRMAIHHARQELQIGESMTIESILGTVFEGRVAKTLAFGPYPAVIPEVQGTAHVTGQHEFLINPNDPLKDGFIMR